MRACSRNTIWWSARIRGRTRAALPQGRDRRHPLSPSLASGFLTGKYRSKDDAKKSARGSGATKYLDERGERVLAALDEIAAERKASVAQVALAWLLAKPELTAPIASATSVAQLDELLGAVRLDLGPGDVARLDAASA